MRVLFTLGWTIVRAQLEALRASKGRHRLLEIWRTLMVALPSAALVTASIGGIVRGIWAGEELLPLMLIIPLMLFGLATVFPMLGLMLAGVTSAPIAWLVGARRQPVEPQTL